MEKGIYYIKYFKESGVEGYVIKDNGLKEVVNALEIITYGGQFFSLEVETAYQKYKKQDFPLLTNQEKKIFELRYRGIKPKEIAGKLFIETKTIDAHCMNMVGKYRDAGHPVNNFDQLKKFFIEVGYIHEIITK